MTVFNPHKKDSLTYGEILDPAMKITEKEDAMQYKKAYIEWTQKKLDEEPRSDSVTAEEIVNTNIGYYAGYGSIELRERIEELFEVKHPILGKA